MPSRGKDLEEIIKNKKKIENFDSLNVKYKKFKIKFWHQSGPGWPTELPRHRW